MGKYKLLREIIKLKLPELKSTSSTHTKTSLVDQQWFSEPKEIISKHKGKLVKIAQLEKKG